MKKLLPIFDLIKDYRKYIYQSLFVSVILIFVGIPGPYLSKLLFDNVYPTSSINLLYFIVAATFAIAFFKMLIDFFHKYFTSSISTKMSLEVRMKLYDRLQYLNFEFFDKHKTGEIVTRFGDMKKSIGGVVGMFNTIVLSILSIIVFIPLLLWLDWRLTLISMAFLPIELFLMYYSGKKLKEKNKVSTEFSAEASAKLYESLNAAKTIKSLGLESQFFKKNETYMSQAREKGLLAVLYNQIFGAIFSNLGNFSTTLNMLIGWSFILQNEISIGTFIAFGSYISNVRSPLKSLVNIISQYQQLLVHIDRFYEYYNNPIEDQTGDTIEIGSPSIHFNMVDFSYDKSNPILNDIDLYIKPGEKVLITGSSGVGKTTLAQLLVRFYDVTKGQIFIDGINIKSFSLKSLREQVVYVLQEPYIFNDTINNNITYGHKNVNREEINKIVEICRIDEFLSRLPNGINSIIYERGQNFSPGQKQRIALARALLKQPKIILLDESTSAIDLRNEALILQNIRKYYPTTSIIMISHRKESRRFFDRVLELNKNELFEMENQELLERSNKIEA